MSQKPMPIPEPEEDETQSNISETPSVISWTDLQYPTEHFAPEYLAQQSLDVLKTMKKACKIRAKTEETNESYIRVISEWYAKKTTVEPAKKGEGIRGKVKASAATTNVRAKAPLKQVFTAEELNVYKTHTISNRDSMRDKVHQIHNFLRNKGAGYGLAALKVFNLFWGLKKIEDMNLIEKLNLTDIPKFSELYQLAISTGPERDRNHEKLQSAVIGTILDKLSQRDTRYLLFYEIPRNIIPETYAKIVELIHELGKMEVSSDMQLSGKIYEYFIGRDNTAISELGAYFTDRHITKWIYKNLCSAKVNSDGTLPTMTDPFGGSGGFTTGFIMHMIELAKNQKTDIKWDTELHKVFHFDINHDVLNSAALEFLCLTETVPRTGDHGNIKYNNSFESDFGYAGTTRTDTMKFDYIVTNPPYGGDTIKTSENKDRNSKICEYIKGLLNALDSELTEEYVALYTRQLAALKQIDEQEREEQEEHKVKFESCSTPLKQYILNTETGLGFSHKDAEAKFNDKESCSLALLMMLSAPDGEVIGVLKEGVMFDSGYKDLRRKLITMFNVTDVISVPASEFENTTTKTSILKFRNTAEKTTTVRFGELCVKRYAVDVFGQRDGGIICIEHTKGEIEDIICRPISVATADQILNHAIVSLNGKEYANREIIPGDGYKMVALGDLCELYYGTRILKKDVVQGIYPLYGGGDITCYIDKYNREGFNVLISRFGMSKKCVRLLTDKFYLNDSGLTLIVQNENYKKYIGFVLTIINDFIYTLSTRSVQTNLNKTMFLKCKIPVPESQAVLDNWVSRLSEAYDSRLAKAQRAKLLEKQVMDRIKEITENEDCDEVKLGDVCNTKCGIKCYLQNYIVDKSNHIVLRTRNLTGSIDFMYINEDGYKLCKNSIVSVNDILMSAFTDSYVTCKINNTMAGNAFNGGLFRLNNIKINVDYLNYTLNQSYFIDKLKHISSSSNASQFNTTKLVELTIKLPQNKQLITELEPTFQEIESLKLEAHEAEKQYTALLNELKADAIKAMPADYMDEEPLTGDVQTVTDENETVADE